MIKSRNAKWGCLFFHGGVRDERVFSCGMQDGKSLRDAGWMECFFCGIWGYVLGIRLFCKSFFRPPSPSLKTLKKPIFDIWVLFLSEFSCSPMRMYFQRIKFACVCVLSVCFSVQISYSVFYLKIDVCTALNRGLDLEPISRGRCTEMAVVETFYCLLMCMNLRITYNEIQWHLFVLTKRKRNAFTALTCLSISTFYNIKQIFLGTFYHPK